MDKRFEVDVEEDVEEMAHGASAGCRSLELSADRTPRSISRY